MEILVFEYQQYISNEMHYVEGKLILLLNYKTEDWFNTNILVLEYQEY